ncbi:MAG: GIY-YIG nuclease family protein [Thermodesulfobacteriota bacterium]|nr:GIY-YIG nuclease family protein [Thermodesulfobacteriota bacterium]
MYTTYKLYIEISKSVTLQVGKLGRFTFPKGFYMYTGSGKKNIIHRILRHFKKVKKLHWHIDYLLDNSFVEIKKIELCNEDECIVNKKVSGQVIVPGFGSADCRNGCKSHLKLRNRSLTPR